MKKIKACILGCGRVSRFHARAYQQLARIELMAGVDISPVARGSFASLYSVPTYSTVTELLEHDKPDLVSICTPNYLHKKMACGLMSLGINVIVEKPVCLTEAEGEELLFTEHRTGVVASTCFQYRFNTGIIEMRRCFESGLMGNILIGNATVRWYRKSDYYADHWHESLYKSGGGALMTQTIHHVDILRWFMGDPLCIASFKSTLSRRMDVEDALVAALKFKNNQLSTVECSTVSYPEDIEASITFIGSKGTIKVGGKSLNKLDICTIAGSKFKKVGTLDKIVDLYGTNHLTLIKDVVSSIITGKKPAVSLEEGVKAVNLVNRIYQSCK